MKRYTISTKKVGQYTFPQIVVRHFNSPFKWGAYCADNGSLWTNLDDGKNIFANKKDAENRLKEIVAEIVAELQKAIDNIPE